MQYYVLSLTGQKFGPADVNTLAEWVKQGRLLPNTMLEEVGTGRQVMAQYMHGLGFPPAGTGEPYQGGQYQSGPQQNNAYQAGGPIRYPDQVESPGDRLAKIAKRLGYLGFFLCPVFCLVGMGYAAMAIRHKSPKGKGAMMVCFFALVLQVLITALVYRGIFAAYEQQTNAAGVDIGLLIR